MLRLAIPVVATPGGGRRARHRERHRARRRDRHEHPHRGSRGAEARGLRRRSWWRPARRCRCVWTCRARSWSASSAAWTSSRRSRPARGPSCADKRVVVVGGGNVAMDAARTARRLAACESDDDGRAGGDGRRPDGTTARCARGGRRVPTRARRDAGAARRGRPRRAGRRAVHVPGCTRGGPRGRARPRDGAALRPDGTRPARRVRPRHAPSRSPAASSRSPATA